LLTRAHKHSTLSNIPLRTRGVSSSVQSKNVYKFVYIPILIYLFNCFIKSYISRRSFHRHFVLIYHFRISSLVRSYSTPTLYSDQKLYFIVSRFNFTLAAFRRLLNKIFFFTLARRLTRHLDHRHKTVVVAAPRRVFSTRPQINQSINLCIFFIFFYFFIVVRSRCTRRISSKFFSRFIIIIIISLSQCFFFSFREEKVKIQFPKYDYVRSSLSPLTRIRDMTSYEQSI